MRYSNYAISSRPVWLAVLCLIGAMAPSTVAEASPQNRVEANFTIGGRLIYDESYELFSSNAGMATIAVSGAWLPAGAGERLAFDLSLGYSGSDVRSFATALTSRLSTATLTVGAAYRQPVIGSLFVFARAGTGAERGTVNLDDGASRPFRGSAWAAVLEGSAGLELALPTRRVGRDRQDMTFRLEGGYGLRPFGARFDRVYRDVKEDGDPEPIERTSMDLGRLDVSGWVIRGSWGYRF